MTVTLLQSREQMVLNVAIRTRLIFSMRFNTLASGWRLRLITSNCALT
jgi:hypothetical protein